MAKIDVEGKKYTVTESLGYQGGYCAKAVETADGEKIAVKRGGVWTWWTARDRVGQRSHIVGMSNVVVEPRRGSDVGSDPLFAGVKPTAWYCDCTNGYGERSRVYTENADTLGLRHPLYSREDVIKILTANEKLRLRKGVSEA